ncbi:IclR family transcriptional regulator [Mesorhizobium sanjuanii]|uniref:IclR family transcriptional regulator n=1 Tax=Mesorhizobium sanjuanii TaxID=2037900 RepID=UPI000E1DF021|nr:IclR family transcriptional regulator [Mesorhizobium sanjuanii]
MPVSKIHEPKSGPLERYVTVLETVVSAPDGLTTRDLETMLGLPKTTVNRLLSALAASDLLVSGKRRGSFILGPRLSQILQSDTAWIELASKRLLKSLAEESGETCFIVRLYGATVRSLVMESPDASVGVYVTPGHILPPHATATGKLLAAMQEPSLREAILQTELKRLTPHTIVDRAELEEEYHRIRVQGYAVENGEQVRGLFTIACPIVLMEGQAPIYALGMTGPAERMGSQPLSLLVTKLQQTAAEFANVFTPNGKKRP